MRLNINSSALQRAMQRQNTNPSKKDKIFLALKKHWQKGVLLLAGTASVAALVTACNSNKTDEPTIPVTPDTQQTDTADGGEDVEETDDFSLLADELGITGLGMTNDMPTIEEVEESLNQQLGGNTYTGPIYTDDTGTAWTSEEDAKKAEDAGLSDAKDGASTVTVASGYYDPISGFTFETKEDADAYNAAQKQGDKEQIVDYEGDFFQAPDGTLWTSEEEYQKSLQDSTTITPVENGEIVQQGEGFLDPDGGGFYWESEQDYWDYKNSQDVIYTPNDGTSAPEYEGTGDTIVEGNYYKDPEGNYWASEEEYREYIGATNARSASYSEDIDTYSDDSSVYDDSYEDTTVYEDTTTYEDVETTDDYFHAPDGSVWLDEQSWLDFTNSSNEEYVEDASEEVVEETVQQGDQTVSDNYYQDPEGNIWASEADYIEYMEYINQTVNEDENQKSR